MKKVFQAIQILQNNNIDINWTTIHFKCGEVNHISKVISLDNDFAIVEIVHDSSIIAIPYSSVEYIKLNKNVVIELQKLMPDLSTFI